MAETITTPQELASLKAAATKEYSLKNYVAAADLYSEATELQASVNGEMDPENADLLYLYGRCLYHVAVSKSDVLGGKVAGGDEPVKKKRKTKPTVTEEKLSENVVKPAVGDKEGNASAEKDGDKPYFQITGDENWTDSEDEGDDVDAEDPSVEEEEDDFATAYEILDVARVLLSRKLELQTQETQGKGKGKETAQEESPEARHIMERLADTHDLQAEISLENERFHDAISDSRSALEFKQKLFPIESSLIAEAHFKLSLALEFASVTAAQTEGEATEPDEPKSTQVDEDLRQEAVTHMESAIASCKLRVSKEEASLAELKGDQAKEKARSIKDVKEMVVDMEQRLVDLRNPAVNLNGMGGPADAPDASNPLGGILGSMLGETPAQQKVRIEQATKGANDLSGLIRKKPAKPAAKLDAATSTSESSSKRKAEDAAGEQTREKGKGKKVKFDDTPADV